MALETYKLAMPDRLLVFVGIQNSERLSAIGDALFMLGARFVGPQVFSLGRNAASPEIIRDALSSFEIEQDDCIYIVDVGGKVLETYGIVAPRLQEGIVLEPRQGE